jgi:frataxin-like iron-binding protein CyaY
MIKIGTTKGGVIVKLSDNEFSLISNGLENAKEDVDIDITWLKTVINLFVSNKKEFIDLSTRASSIISSIEKLKGIK